MGDKKRVQGIVIGLLVLTLSVSFVSAGFLDLFKFGDNSDLEGELGESAVATVSILDTTPPNITFVSDVDDTMGGSNSVTPYIRTVSSGNTPVTFSFLAQQGGGVGNLDDTPGTFNSNATFNRVGSTPRENSSCITIGQVACGSLCTGNAVNYSCTITMRYYDDPTDWNITAIARDTSGRFGINSTKQFTVASVSASSSQNTALNWTNPPLTTSVINRYNDAATNYIVDNDGNTAIPTTSVNATNLTGKSDSAFVILASKFTASSTAPVTCGGEDLGQDTNPAITGFTVPKATSDSGSHAQLYFCLKDVAGLSSQEYEGGRSWIITLQN